MYKHTLHKREIHIIIKMPLNYALQMHGLEIRCDANILNKKKVCCLSMIPFLMRWNPLIINNMQ